MEKVFLIECDCTSVSHITKYHVDPEYKSVYISYNISPKNFLDKLKSIWYIISGRYLYLNDVVYSDKQIEQLKELVNYYEQHSKENQ